MTLQYGGSFTIGECIPMAALSVSRLQDAISLTKPDIQARITGLTALSIQPPPTLPALIASVQNLLDALQAMVTDPVPDVNATLPAIDALNLQLGALNVGDLFAAQLGTLLSAAGVRYWVYQGRADQLSSDMAGQVSQGIPGGAGPAEQIGGVILMANDGGTISALLQVLQAL
jgi:hypothetical protein